MAWYNGTVAEAIAESKRSSKLFVVFVTGNDEDSQRMNEIWEKETIKSFCQTHCVCLKLANDSTDCQQFAQIYPVLMIPITYCIGTSGAPIEILPGFGDENLLIGKLQLAVQSLQSSVPAQTNAALASAVQSDIAQCSTSHSNPPIESNRETEAPLTTASQNLAAENPAATTRPADVPAPAYSDDDDVREAGEAAAGSAEATKPSPSTTEKVQQLQAKINEFRTEKAAQAQMEERKKEIARRTTGKQMQEMKEKQTDMRRQMELAERKKEAAANKEALERVRADIARDRAEKQKKYEGDMQARKEEEQKRQQEKEEKAQKESEAQARLREKVSRVQYRFPDGSALTRQYDSSSLLRECFDDLEQEASAKLPKNFELFTTVPSHVFDDADKAKTLRELDLVPSVAIYIRPQRTAVQPSSSPFFDNMVSLVMFIFMFPFNLMKKAWDFVSGSGGGDTAPPPSASSTTRYADNTKKSSYLRRRNIPGGSGGDRETVRDGRMHRLHDVRREDDDDNATWNGNSTQQM